MCVVSFHPLVYPIARGLLPESKYEVVEHRASSDVLGPAMGDALPEAAVYVVEANPRGSATRAVIEGISTRHPKTPVVVLGETFDQAEAFPLMQLRVRGLVTFADASSQLARAIEAMLAGGFWISRTLLTGFLEASIAGDGRAGRPGSADLTQREQQVLEEVVRNLSNKEIAKRLGITERGVKFHVSNLLAKHHVRRRSDLVLLFLTGSGL